MRKLLIAIACLSPAVVTAQGKFTVQGKIAHLTVSAKAYLFYKAGTSQIIDSTVVTAGNFTFTGSLSDITAAQIRVVKDATSAAAQPDVLGFYLEPRNVQLVSTNDSIKYAIIKGSAVNDDHAKYKALIKPVNDKGEALFAEYQSKTPEEKKDEAYMKTVYARDEVLQKELANINRQFYTANRDSYISLLIYRSLLGSEFDAGTAELDFSKFTDQVKATGLGKNIADMIAAAKGNQIGGFALDFTQNDVNNKPVKLSDFKGKYVLLDFWASWCGPCRAENPNVVAAYKAYKDKNFTVLGVSLDRPGSKDQWLQAIEKDGLTWTHVSDLKWWENAVAKQYGIKSIPANYLIDPNGKIIAKNIRGEELQKKLAEILGTSQTK